MIRIGAAWIAVEPLDMGPGVDMALARVVSVFGAGRSHHAYLFLNRRANQLKVPVHDGFGFWLCARRVQRRHFVRPDTHLRTRIGLTHKQLRALVVNVIHRDPTSDCAFAFCNKARNRGRCLY